MISLIQTRISKLKDRVYMFYQRKGIMQIQENESALEGKGEFIDPEELAANVRQEFAEVQEDDVSTVLEIYLPKRKLPRVEYLSIYATVRQQLSKVTPKEAENTHFLFNSLLQVEDARILIKPVPSTVDIDANSDFQKILGEQFYRKLVTYGSTGLLFEKFEEQPQRSYSFFHWIENKTEIPLNEEGDSLYLQMLKRIWMFQFPEAVHLLRLIDSSFHDAEVPAMELGLCCFAQIYQGIAENEQLKQVFMERREFAIRYEEGQEGGREVWEFNQKITEIRERLNFNANYFAAIRTRLAHPCFQAAACFLSNREDNYVKDNDPTLAIRDISITDRFFYARRFCRAEDFETFKNGLLENFASFWELEYIVLFGTRRESEVILQNYVDETGEVQRAAVVSVYLRLFLEQGKIGIKDSKMAFYTRFIRYYEFLLAGMDLGISKHKFDQKCVTIEVQRKKKAMNKTFSFNCPNCKNGQSLLSLTKRIANDLKQHQLRMKGNNYYSKDTRNQVKHCLDCMQMLPKCAVCLNPLTVYNGYAEEIKKNSALTKPKNCGEGLGNAIVWCPKCFHGGHFAHVMRWMKHVEKKCPVYSCKCKCSL